MKIDRIYITHYKKLTDRKKYLQKVLKKHSLLNITTFMENWDRNQVKKEEYEKYYDMGNKKGWVTRGTCKYYQMKKKSFRNLSKAEIFNFLNHYDCYKDMIKNNYQNVLVLEDDAILGNDFNKKLKECMEQSKKIDWDVIFLGKYMNNHIDKVIKKNYSTNVKKNKLTQNLYLTGFSNTADSYILSRKAVETILNKNTFPFSLPIDFEMNYWFEQFDMKVFWFNPGFVGQGSMKDNYTSSAQRPKR